MTLLHDTPGKPGFLAANPVKETMVFTTLLKGIYFTFVLPYNSVI